MTRDDSRIARTRDGISGSWEVSTPSEAYDLFSVLNASPNLTNFEDTSATLVAFCDHVVNDCNNAFVAVNKWLVAVAIDGICCCIK